MTAQATSVDFFYPSASNASSIDREIRQTLNQSLTWCFDQSSIELQLASPPEGWHARPADFGAYYDLLVAITNDGVQSDASLGHVRRFQNSIGRRGIAQPSNKSFRPELIVSTLRKPWYDDEEVNCLVRWLDTEPENAMGLSPLDDLELAEATEKLQAALEAMQALIPEFLEEMLAVTTEIIFAKPSGEQKLTFGGASSFSLWGAVALNTQVHPEWWFYLPRLVHEYSHNLLFGIARDEPLVLNDPQETYPSPLRQELRPMDGIFHAAFVSAREALALREILNRLPEQTSSRFDRLGRYCRQTLEDSEQSFEDCLSVVRQYGRLSELGDAVLRDTERAMRASARVGEAARPPIL